MAGRVRILAVAEHASPKGSCVLPSQRIHGVPALSETEMG
jgi:hypothetical protein